MTGLLANFAYLSAVRFNSDVPVFVVDVRTPLGKFSNLNLHQNKKNLFLLKNQY